MLSSGDTATAHSVEHFLWGGSDRHHAIVSGFIQLRQFTHGQSSSGRSRAMVYLNVYDLTHINSYLYWFGCGIFHSGIEAHGLEYGFGAHEYPSSGVFEVEPRSCPGFIFRRSILLGSTELSRTDFRSFMEYLSNKYHGDTYNLISKNCNHFTDEVAMRLTGKPIPGWVNRLARLEEGADSGASSATEESEEEDLSHHLFSTPDGDVEFLQDRPVRLAKDIL
ncbi:UNVERIFIED_CONTAM: DeSI-like protein [Sesamum radiatum]|uniref:DeSI-like protein n=1 Tax=Sesamum radiatum TaxID=300843 RepID=A0AAW2RWY9_SESRA